MKSLQQYIKEQLVFELSEKTLKSAYHKQVEKNGGKESQRSLKFLKGAKDALQREKELHERCSEKNKLSLEEWMDDTVLTDKQGKPIEVYHGDGLQYLSNSDADEGYFFTRDYKYAKSYSTMNLDAENAFFYIASACMPSKYNTDNYLADESKHWYGLEDLTDEDGNKPTIDEIRVAMVKANKEMFGNPRIITAYVKNYEEDRNADNEVVVDDISDIYFVKTEKLPFKPISDYFNGFDEKD